MLLRTTLAVLLIGCLCIPVFCSSLTQPMRQEDPHLEKTVSLVSSRIFVGELIEKLSEQSGVPLSVDEEDGAGDVEVTVNLKNVPLADAMDALWSLVSYQSAEWDWERTGQSGSFRYELKQPQAARTLATRLQEEVQQELEGQSNKMLAALKMRPEQLQEAAKQDKLLASLTNNIDPRVRPGLSIFGSLSAKTQEQILHNQGYIQLPVSQLSETQRAFVHSQWQAMVDRGVKHKRMDGTVEPLPEPTEVSIHVHRYGDEIAPSLTVDVGYGSGDYVGGGWMEKEWQKKVQDLWILPGDLIDSPLALDTVRPPLKAAAEQKPKFEMAYRVLQLAQAAPLSVIARLPDETGHSTSASDMLPYNQTVQAYLQHLQDQARFAHKWRDHILLLSYPAWFMDETKEAPIPWSLVAYLRDVQNTGDGFLSLQDLAHAARQLNATQLRHLADTIPAMSSVAYWHDLFALISRSPSLLPYLLSSQGSTRADALDAVRGPLQADQFIQDKTADRVRVVQTNSVYKNTPVRMLDIQLLDKDGRVLADQGIGYAAHQFQSGVSVGSGTEVGGNAAGR